MQPEIHIGPLTLQTFGIMFALRRSSPPGAGRREAAEGARQAGRLGLRADLRRAGRRDRRVAARLHHRELRRRSPTTCSATSSPAPAWSGTAARSAARSASCSGRGGARCSTSRCSTSARRRSRSATRSGGSAASSRATATTGSRGTGRGRWPIRTAPCRPTMPVHPTPDLRDAGDGPGRLRALAPARPLAARPALRPLPGPRRAPSASWSSSSAATTTSLSGSPRRSW